MRPGRHPARRLLRAEWGRAGADDVGAAWGAVAYNVVIAGVICYWAFWWSTRRRRRSPGISSLLGAGHRRPRASCFSVNRPACARLAGPRALMATVLVLIWPAQRAGPMAFNHSK